jgi:hypothetical protein
MNGCEIREYSAHIVAQTTLQGSYGESIRSVFSIVAGYIFGGNTKKESIAMTAPVGNMSHLQFLAARKFFIESENAVASNKIELSYLSEEQTERYFEIYESLKKRWWWETQKTIDQYEKWAVESLDRAILQK